MPFKVCLSENSPFVMCDSPEEAMALMRAWQQADSEQPQKESAGRRNQDKTALTEEQAMAKFILELKPKHRTFLSVLSHHADGITGEKLAVEANLETSSFGALTSAISKNAARNQIKYKDLLLSDMRFDGSRRYRFFKPKPLLMRWAGKIVGEQLKLAG